MKKCVIFLPIALLCCTLQGTRVRLHDGNFADVPDKVTVINDLNEDVTVYEKVGWIDGYAIGTYELSKSQSRSTKTLFILEGIETEVNKRKHFVKYPRLYHYDCNKNDIFEDEETEFKYKLSDIVAAINQKKEFTPAFHIIVSLKEEFWLGLANRDQLDA